MRFVLPLLVLVVLGSLTGCTRTRVINPALQEDRTRTNHLATGERVLVTLADGRRLRAEGLHMAPDVTTWLHPLSDSLWTVPTSQIAAVQQVDNPRGGLQGFGLGLAFGATVGSALILSAPTADSFEGGVGAVLGASLVACTAPLLGGFIGFARGDRTTHVVADP